MGNFREKHETAGGAEMCRNRHVTNRGSQLVRGKNGAVAIRRLTGGGKQAAALGYCCCLSAMLKLYNILSCWSFLTVYDIKADAFAL